MVSGSLALPPYLLFVLHVSRIADSNRMMSCRIKVKSVHLSIGPSIHLSIRLFIHSSVCLFVHQFNHPSICPERLAGASPEVQGGWGSETDERMDGRMHRCILQDMVFFESAA